MSCWGTILTALLCLVYTVACSADVLGGARLGLVDESQAESGYSDLVDDDDKCGHEFTGRHLIATYSACNPSRLRNTRALLVAMASAVKASGATLLKTSYHLFPPHGLTAVMLLSESHASIHTYPEHGACFVDLFTCGRSCVAERFDAALREYLRPKAFDRRILLRHQGIEEDTLRRA
jgi:S-adenosylmethionine decarboxylase